MDYFKLLHKIAGEAKLKYVQISRICEKNNVPFDENYISSYKNRSSIPTDNVSRAIARACGRHKELLVVQAYYDKSPEVFKNMFDTIIKIVKATILTLLWQKATNEAIKEMQRKFDQMFFAEWLEYNLSDTAKQVGDAYDVFVK